MIDYVLLIGISTALMLGLISRYNLQLPTRLIVLNLILPGFGLLYVIYILQVVVPRQVAKETGEKAPGGLLSIEAVRLWRQYWPKCKPYVDALLEKIFGKDTKRF